MAAVHCWCGNTKLEPFSPEYLLCSICHTLTLKQRADFNINQVTDDQSELYGKYYHLTHLPQKYGYPEFDVRVRNDLPERCLYWLRTLLKYKPPPAKVLELGSGHGGFVAMLRWVGYDASGLELSPWVVDFARKTFDVPMLLGPVEDQEITPASIDVITLMDVLEHLINPVGTMEHCLNLLKSNGILIIQTPRFPGGKSYEEMKRNNDSFLFQLKEAEHIFLFSERSIRSLFQQIDTQNIEFVPAIFAHYDMFIVASKSALTIHTNDGIFNAISSHPAGRLVQAMIDLDDARKLLIGRLDDCEADRAARLEIINKISVQLQESEVDRAARLQQINELTDLLKKSEADRAARLQQINELSNLLKDSEADRAARLAVINHLEGLLKTSETDREAKEKKLDKLNEELKNIKLKMPYRLLKKIKLLP